MNPEKQQIVERLKAANTILVTVSTNPSVDQLAACIGLTLLLNKLDKHTTAVFSGDIPPTITFLKPEETLEKTTDSLRDFIIALDKSKADKLRYKVEDQVVRIFITPYRASITQKDLDFSQGDFNVDVVVALGVHQQQDLDSAITAHGRILHDAVVVSVNTTLNNDLGSIAWQDATASSLSELVAGMVNDFGSGLLDEQIATALLSGIVAETSSFSNSKTSSLTMSLSAQLLAAGANQQLVASKLQSSQTDQPSPDEHNGVAETGRPDVKASSSENLEIAHPENEATDKNIAGKVGTPKTGKAAKTADRKSDTAKPAADTDQPDRSSSAPALSLPAPAAQAESTPAAALELKLEPGSLPATPSPAIDDDQPTLAEIEDSVRTAQLQDKGADGIDSARQAVVDALKSVPETDQPPEPIEALGAQRVDLDMGHEPSAAAPPSPAADQPLSPSPLSGAQPQSPPAPASPQPFDFSQPTPIPPPYNSNPQGLLSSNLPVHEPAPLQMSPADQPFTMPLPPSVTIPPPQVIPPTASSIINPAGPPPPPVPPPLMPF